MTGNTTPRSTATSSKTRSKSGWRIGLLLVQVALAAVFLYSAVSKVLDVYTFGLVLKSYDLLPEGIIKPLAITLPLVEFSLGVAILFQQTARFAGIGLGVLSFLFLLVMIAKWGTVLPYGCGCFGPTAATPVGIVDVGKDVLFLLGALFVVFAAGRLYRRGSK